MNGDDSSLMSQFELCEHFYERFVQLWNDLREAEYLNDIFLYFYTYAFIAV